MLITVLSKDVLEHNDMYLHWKFQTFIFQILFMVCVLYFFESLRDITMNDTVKMLTLYYKGHKTRGIHGTDG